MQFKHVEYFVKASECKSLNEAAKNLFISQPSLSAAIATLEQELGYPLFVRSKSGISLTAKGELILPQARQLLDIQKEWLALADQPSGIQGEVHFTAPEIVCNTILLEVIMKASQRYPALKLSLRSESPKILPPIVTNHFLSLAIDFCPPDDLTDRKHSLAENGWDMSPVANTNSVVFLNTTNPLARQQEIFLDQLKQFNLVTYDQYMFLPYAEIFTIFSKKQIKRLPSRESMFNLISRDANYIGLFSSICINHCPYIKDGTICARSIQDYPTPTTLILQFPQNRKNDILLRVITELLQESVDILKTTVTDGSPTA